jgi:hypothetical protein
MTDTLFRHWPKIPRLENEIYHISEKIDGTNACIIIQPWLDTNQPKPIEEINTDTECYGIWAQSRTCLIYPDKDNFDFAKWVQNNAEQLVTDLGPGYHFGEWWGLGINRGYGLNHKRFSLFNPTKQSSICYNVPLLISNEEEINKWLQESPLNLRLEYWKEQFKLNGSYAAPGYMRPEGLIVYAEKAKTYWKVIIDK